MTRLITRHTNRKLYDPTARRYVPLADIVDLVVEGDSVKVVEHPSGEDATPRILAQGLVDLVKRRAQSLPADLMETLLRLAGGAKLVEANAGGLFTWFGKSRVSDITFTNNTTTKAGAGPVLRFEHVDGLTVSGNTQPVTSGSVTYISDSTNVLSSDQDRTLGGAVLAVVLVAGCGLYALRRLAARRRVSSHQGAPSAV